MIRLVALFSASPRQIALVPVLNESLDLPTCLLIYIRNMITTVVPAKSDSDVIFVYNF